MNWPGRAVGATRWNAIPSACCATRANEFISRQSAHDDYGVVLDDALSAVDAARHRNAAGGHPEATRLGGDTHRAVGGPGMSTYRLGVDIGGTFTDIVFLADDGSVITRKVSSHGSTTTPRAIVEGVGAVLAETGILGRRHRRGPARHHGGVPTPSWN